MKRLTLPAPVLEQELQKAISNDFKYFFLSFQPIIDLSTNRIVGVEALTRWNHPELGTIPPDQFIAVAEATELIIALDAWVLRTACEQVTRWIEKGYSVLVSVNLSAVDLKDPQLVSTIKEILTETECPPSHLMLEITETAPIVIDPQMIATLRSLKALEVASALDDFGQGGSTLYRLQKLPVHAVKIDRCFITNILTNPTSRLITQSIIELAKRLQLTCIAEGIETEAQATCLRSLGCDSGQGYYWSRPLPAEEMTQLLRSDAAVPPVHTAS